MPEVLTTNVDLLRENHTQVSVLVQLTRTYIVCSTTLSTRRIEVLHVHVHGTGDSKSNLQLALVHRKLCMFGVHMVVIIW